MKRYLILLSTLISLNVYAQSANDTAKIKQIFSNKELKLSFANGLPLSSMASIVPFETKSPLKIYFDQNIDTTQSLPQDETKITPFHLFNDYMTHFKLKYKFETPTLVRVYKDENYVATTPYLYSTVLFVSQQQDECYIKVQEIIEKYKMNHSMQNAPLNSSTIPFGLSAHPMNATFGEHRIGFTCITQSPSTEFLHLTVTGVKYPEVVKVAEQFISEFK